MTMKIKTDGSKEAEAIKNGFGKPIETYEPAETVEPEKSAQDWIDEVEAK